MIIRPFFPIKSRELQAIEQLLLYSAVLLSFSYSNTLALTTFQGIDEGPDGLKLISDLIREQLKIEMSVLMGANIAKEVADEKFCETTIGNYCKESDRAGV